MVDLYLWPVPEDINPADVRLRDPAASPAAALTGWTRNAADQLLLGAVVQLFRTADDAILGEQLSGLDGSFSFAVAGATDHYIVAYLAGAPDLAGTTLNTLRSGDTATVYLWPVPAFPDPADVRLGDPTAGQLRPPTYSWIGIPERKPRTREELELIVAGRFIEPGRSSPGSLPEIFAPARKKRRRTPAERFLEEHRRREERRLLGILNDLRIEQGRSLVRRSVKKRLVLPAGLQYYYLSETHRRWRARLEWLRRDIRKLRRKRRGMK